MILLLIDTLQRLADVAPGVRGTHTLRGTATRSSRTGRLCSLRNEQ